ncbi:MAG: beta-N-acetylhexosaminidase [Neptuniibacter caesariensis]|uniref:beta-N-acetylhexosaminidase n=1 Tax=Neptuniibacter caesariensis TaxID=207954 RepID=A0A2G6JPJ9_NEPCE|nr:MAG: beta-N-acetylhexosaminidase [Neptuniibacter caesariensis]
MHNSYSASLFLDLDGVTLSSSEQRLLKHPLVGGVILFSRNTENAEQVAGLVKAIRSIRPDLVISLDQEGGRVQRLKEGVTRLPAVKSIVLADGAEQQKQNNAEQLGYLMAMELRLLDIDLSFAPVVDVDYGRNTVIGNRAFGCDVATVIQQSSSYINGMRKAGMPATAKHFPGHGWANADTHHADAIDERSFTEICHTDLLPFKTAIEQGVEAMMLAHVVYTQCDPAPAGFSKFWLQEILRQELGFKGIIFSDDLSMKAAHSAGTPAQRAQRAIEAGCQVLLCCNDRAGWLEVLAYLEADGVAPCRALSSLRGQVVSVDEKMMQNARVLAEALVDMES